MRARNLKPGYFKNEILGSADPLIGILFQGLWCSADREGRLEDRPLRLCVDIFPYRRSVTEKKVDAWLKWLDEQKFIRRYEADGKRYIQVLEFKKHQNPHKNERPSIIPELSSTQHSASKVNDTGQRTLQAQGNDDESPERLGLTPDSLTPDSLNPHSPHSRADSVRDPSTVPAQCQKGPDSKPPPIDLTDAEHHERFERIKAAYPKFIHRQDWLNAEVACRNHVGNADATWDSLLAVTDRYAKHIRAKGDEGTQFVKTPGKFFAGNDGDAFWRQEWPIPTPANGKSRPAPAPVKYRTADEIEAEERARGDYDAQH